MHRCAIGTGTGRIGRIEANKQNAVLLCFLFNPVECVPVGPRCHSVTKLFTSPFLFTSLHIVKRFHAKHGNSIKGQAVNSGVEIMPSLFAGASFPLASRLTTFDLISNRFELASVVCSVRECWMGLLAPQRTERKPPTISRAAAGRAAGLKCQALPDNGRSASLSRPVGPLSILAFPKRLL
jgi:hypothetical protein